jgi:NAD/FAD-utilizing enzyme apparently involved in cell division
MRLTEKGFAIGLVDDKRYAVFEDKRKRVAEEIERLKRTALTVTESVKEILAKKGSTPLQQSTFMVNLLRRPEIKYADLADMLPGHDLSLPEEIKEAIEIEVKYEGYIKKQLAMVEKFERLENKKIPRDIDYRNMRGISTEALQKMDKIKPESIGQAARISGVSPADISVLLIHLEQQKRMADAKVQDSPAKKDKSD